MYHRSFGSEVSWPNTGINGLPIQSQMPSIQRFLDCVNRQKRKKAQNHKKINSTGERFVPLVM
jgi:hypothetical protein